MGDIIKPKVHVILQHSLSRKYTDGQTKYVVEASRVGYILRALDDLHPGIREHLEEETAVSIGGMIYDGAYL